jgi:hypothetical protein
VTVTQPGLTESKRVAVSFAGEQTNALKASQVKITNNKNKNDTIAVSSIKKGDVVKVYNADGKQLAKSEAAKGTSTSITIKQLGTKKGTVYLTVTSSGMKESHKTAVSYSAEK